MLKYLADREIYPLIFIGDIMSKYYNFSAQHLPINETQVEQALDRVTTYLLPETQPFTFQERLSELHSLKNILIAQEKALYSILNIQNIQELQNRIASYKGLSMLNGAKLANHIASLKLVDDSAESLTSIVNRIINSNSFRNSVQIDIQKAYIPTESDVKDIIDAINKQYNTKFVKSARGKFVGLQKLFKDVVIENGIAHVKNLKRSDFSASFLQHLEEIFSSASSNDIGVKLTLTEYNQSIYKGWRMRTEKIKDKKEEEEIRKNFLKICLDFINSEISATNEEKIAFQKSFELVPTSALLISSTSGLQGVIGEVVTGAYLYLLTNGKYNITQTANMFRKNAKQLTSVDVILENFGFQVKNYNEFAYEIPSSIEISKTNALETWEQKFELNGALNAALDTFYGIKGFNIKATEKYSMEPRINSIAKNLSYFFLQYSDKILEMYDELKGQSFFTKETLEGRFYNDFLVMSGKFIPSSYILNTIIQYFESKISLKDFYLFVSSSYSGSTYRTFWEEKNVKDILTFPQVANNTKLTMNWRFHLDNIISSL